MTHTLSTRTQPVVVVTVVVVTVLASQLVTSEEVTTTTGAGIFGTHAVLKVAPPVRPDVTWSPHTRCAVALADRASPLIVWVKVNVVFPVTVCVVGET